MSDPRITISVLNPSDLSEKTTLAEAWGKQFQDVLNDTGSGKCTVANDDPALALVDFGDFVQFSLDGEPVFTWIVEKKEAATVDQAEEYGEATVLSGRGWLAMLEDAVVYPEATFVFTLEERQPKSEIVGFDFSSLFYDTSEFVTPYDYGSWSAPSVVWYDEKPTDFPNSAADWIGPQAPVAGDNPVGYWWFAGINTVVTEGIYRLFVGADNGCDFYVDNALVLSTGVTDFETSKTVDLYLEPGSHWYGARVYNADLGTDNPSGLIATIAQIDPLTGEITSLIMQTDAAYAFAGVIPYSPAPGFTPGFVWAILWSSYNDRSTTPPVVPAVWSLDFDENVDSNGDAWSSAGLRAEQFFTTGLDYLAALRQTAEQFELDFRMKPDVPEVQLFISRGSVTTVTFEPGVNLTDLTHEGVA